MRNFVIYKSSAGSGKTFTLVKDYLKIALSENENPPQKYKSILAITFTNKAAAEMKERILAALKDLSEIPFSAKAETLGILLTQELNIDAETLSKRAKNLFSHIIHHYGNFSINTIDSFTHSIIRSFAFDMNLPVNFSIEMNETEIINKCIDKLISSIGQQPELTKLMLEFSKSQSEEQKSWQVDQKIKEFVSKTLKNPAAQKLDLLKDFTISDFMEIRKELLDFKVNFEKQLEDAADEFFRLIDTNGIQKEDFANGTRGLPSYFSKLKNKNLTENPTTANTKKTIYEDKWTAAKTSKQTTELILSVADEIKSIYHKADQVIEQYHSDYLVAENILNNLYSLSLINEVKKNIEDFKKEENILFISEFNEKISNVVINEPVPFIYEKIGERYNHFLVDEFQDTSNLQWQNLLPLIDNSLSEGNYNLVVGDGKQSIYRWRGGEADQFQALPKLPTISNTPLKINWENTLTNSALIKNLDNNFRSCVNIVEFNNRLFTWIRESHLSASHQEIYNEIVQQPLQKNKGGLITVDLINKKIEQQTPYDKTLKYIQDSLACNYNYSDIAILVRNNEHGNNIASFLNEQNIPVVSSEALLLNNCEEVNFITDILNIIADVNPLIHASSVLMYLCKNAIITTHSIDEALLKVNRSFAPEKELKEILKLNEINFDIKKLLLMPLLECCVEINSTFKIKKNKNYIQFFLDEVIAYTNQNSNSLTAFLEHWEQKKEKAALKIPEDINAVKVMSIHKSKGLEFPVVIMPFCNWKIYRSQSLWIEDEEGKLPMMILGMNKSLNLTPYSEEYEAEKERQLLDNINILYVGFTRASHHMHIISEQYKNFEDEVYTIISGFEKENYEEVEFGKSLRLGEPILHHGKSSKPASFEFELNLGNWNRAIEIKKSNDFFQSTETKEKIESGILIHQLLSKINSSDDLPTVINNAVLEGLIKQEDANEIKNQIEQLISHSDVGKFFIKNQIKYNETEILSSSGKVLRPDRIIIENDCIDIVDFKTGKKIESHEKQLEEYALSLNELGYKKVNKHLVYINPIEVITI
jgi:ATP-dependent exoDNAse (exonuclease V) beta subunit